MFGQKTICSKPWIRPRRWNLTLQDSWSLGGTNEGWKWISRARAANPCLNPSSRPKVFCFGTQRRRSHFFTPRPPLIFPACFLVSSHLLRDSLCTALRTERLWIWSTGLSTQLTPSSRREAWVLGNTTALTERSQLAIRWTRGRGGESYV